MAEIGTYRELKLPARYGGARAARHRGDRPARRTRRRAAAGWRRSWSRRSRRIWRRGEQSLLFLNRRGYAPLTLCRHCGHRFQCPNCTAWMVEHRFTRRLACHHCGHIDAGARRLPGMQGGGQPRRLRPGRRADRRRGRRALPRGAHRDRHLGHDLVAGQGGRVRRADGGGRDRHRHRHPARHQGLSFPEPDPGRRGRRRSRPGGRRPARGRAHLPADPAGLRPRRPRRRSRAASSSRPTTRRRR